MAPRKKAFWTCLCRGIPGRVSGFQLPITRRGRQSIQEDACGVQLQMARWKACKGAYRTYDPPVARLILQIQEQSPLSPLSKPSWEGIVLQRRQHWNMHEASWKREGTREGTKRSTVLPKSLLKGYYYQGEHSPVRVVGHQVFIRTLTKSSIALVKFH